MKIFVCIKSVPDTAATIKLSGESSFEDSDCKFVINPYDEYGIEEAVTLVEKNGGEVVVITAGRASADGALRSAMAIGANRAIHVKTEEQFLDSSFTAKVLKAAIERDGMPDIIFTGKNSVDTEGFQTPYRLAAELGFPVVNEISKLKINGDKAVAEREIGGGDREVLEISLPAVIGVTKGLNEPRYPKFPDIMKAKKKPVNLITISDLGIDELFSKSRLVKLESAPERSGAKMIQGSVEAQVKELIRILKEDEKVL
ncbi:MAG: electron transfer flavoprotein subunit beta/FixA family protein [Desulfamplus sp.]|nr:electron transfer flavoprotein subunit beta/FixA family protein [Desulfamplus sp.]